MDLVINLGFSKDKKTLENLCKKIEKLFKKKLEKNYIKNVQYFYILLKE